MTTEVYVGAGASVGDRLDNLRRGLGALAATPGARIVRTSPVYETEPWGYSDQSPFLNCAALFECALGPKQLLIRLKAIESEMGRDLTAARWHPRPIDLDLLLYGELIMRERGITVPHEYLARRWFTIRPVLDLTPDLHLPGAGKLAASLMDIPAGERGRLVKPALHSTAERGVA